MNKSAAVADGAARFYQRRHLKPKRTSKILSGCIEAETKQRGIDHAST